MAWKEDSLMSWESRKYKDIADTLTSNVDQLELNIKVIEGYLEIIDSETCKRILEAMRENISDIRSDIKDLKGTTTATENTVKDFISDINYSLEVSYDTE